MSKLILNRLTHIIVPFLIVISVCGVGIYTLLFSHAATPYSSSEAESGKLVASASAQVNSSASSDSYVQFGSLPSTSTSGFTSTSSGPSKLQGFAVDGSDFVNNTSAQMSAMLKAFPGMDALRIAIGTSSTNAIASVAESSLVAAINTAIQMDPNVQIILDDHESEGGQTAGVNSADLSLYTDWGDDFKNNAQVSFNTPNEPGGTAAQLEAADEQVYSTIRATGANNRIWLENDIYITGVGASSYQAAITASKMINIGMDTHIYPDGSNTAQQLLDGDGVSSLKDANGVMLQQGVFEFGPSDDGPASDDTSYSSSLVDSVVQAAQSGQSVMTTAWIWTLDGDTSVDGLEDLVATSNGTVGEFGTLLQSDTFAQSQAN
jgi:hypothetical protein